MMVSENVNYEDGEQLIYNIISLYLSIYILISLSLPISLPIYIYLFIALSNQHGKSKSEKDADAKKLGIDIQRQEVQDILDSLESDSDSDYDSEDGDRVVVMNENNEEVQVEAVEVFREKTIEDIIEEQRQALAANGLPGTPVNSETFAAWRVKKIAQKQADAEARLKAEQTKKKGGKGLCKLV